jgi:biopolymer transport protein ExbD/biopolymer transport protein TolR
MRRSSLTPDINVTPLVDVVLVLLIIFMVIAPQMEAGASVDLPGIHNPDPKNGAQNEPITISVTKDGQIYLEKDRIEPESVGARLEELRAKNDGRKVVLKGDRSARYGVIRELFGRCRDLGFSGVALQVGDKAAEEE